MKRVWVGAAGLLFLVLVVGAAGLVMVKARENQAGPAGAGEFEPVEAVEIVPAREMSWQPTADLMGTVFAMRSVTVRNEVAGVVTHVGFRSGDVVEEGQVLLRQDETTGRADLEAAKAAVRVAEANIAQVDSQIKLAEVELGRLASVQSRAVAEVEVDRARTRLDSARADRIRWLAEVDQAKAHAAQVEARLAKLTIKAPFRARTGMRNVHEGQYLAEGVEVVGLQELTEEVYLDFAIPQEYAPRVHEGTTVMATGELLGPDPVRIRVAALDATVSNDTRNLRVRAVVDNPRGVLVPGMFVQVRVPIEAPRTLVVVPIMAVRRAAYANSVFVIAPTEGGDAARAHQRFVTLGQTIGEDIIVLTGLEPGEQVAGAGSFKLRDGAKVMIRPPGSPNGAGAAEGPRREGRAKAAAGKS